MAIRGLNLQANVNNNKTLKQSVYRRANISTEFRFLLPLTVSAVSGLLDWRFLELHLHRQVCGSLPPSCASTLTDDLGDTDHIWGNFEVRSEVADQVISKELFLGHGGQIEGDEENWGCSNLHRCGAPQHNLQHFVVLVEIVSAHSGIQLGNILIWRHKKFETENYC